MQIRKAARSAAALLGALAASIALTTGPASAQLYGLTSAFPNAGDIYTLNTSTGAATLVTSLTGVDFTSLDGLEFLGNTLYATDVFTSGVAQFGTIDLATGAFTAINNQGGSTNWHGLAANQTAGLFYIIDITDGNNLKSVTPAGVITTIGPAGQEGRGMAYDDNAGILYAADGGNLYTVDTSTGASTTIGALGVAAGGIGLAFDPVANVLYANDADAGGLYTVNTTTGAATLIGPNGAVSGGGIDGLAFRVAPSVGAVPEPGTVALFAIGLLPLTGVARRRRTR